MGDSGSMFIGFFLASTALINVGGGRSRSFVPVLAVPILVGLAGALALYGQAQAQASGQGSAGEARFINAASAHEVLYTRNTTESINLVAYTWARANLKQDDLVILTEMEHHSNLVPWHILAAEKGIRLEFIPVTPDGLLDLEAYAALLKQGPKEEWKHIAVTSDRTPGQKNATFIMAYFPHNAEGVFDTSALVKQKLRVAWFDPRTGSTHDLGVGDNTGELKITPPSELHPIDWVLVLTGEG